MPVMIIFFSGPRKT